MRKFVLAGMVVFAAMAMTAAQASTVAIIHSFCKKSGCPDGATPNGLFVAPTGEIYGTTQYNSGTIFEMTAPKKSGKRWKLKTIYNFCALANCADGRNPYDKLIADSSGNLYGTTFAGGTGGFGTVFELVKGTGKKWTLKTLATFCCDNSEEPLYGLSYSGESSGAPYDGISPLFGIAGGGLPVGECEPDCGTVYQVTLSGGIWTLKTIYVFCVQTNCADGWNPVGELLVDATGNNLTGVVQNGTPGAGGVFKLTRNGSSWTESISYAFCKKQNCSDGIDPSYTPTLDAAGDLIGMTALGGNSSSRGILYKLTPAFQEQTLYSFCALSNCADGAQPGGNNVLIDASGALYGATQYGGGNNIDQHQFGGGTLFKFSGGSLQTLYRFCAQVSCADGEYPGKLAFGPSGTIVGVAPYGGAYAKGEIFQITP